MNAMQTMTYTVSVGIGAVFATLGIKPGGLLPSRQQAAGLMETLHDELRKYTGKSTKTVMANSNNARDQERKKGGHGATL